MPANAAEDAARITNTASEIETRIGPKRDRRRLCDRWRQTKANMDTDRDEKNGRR